MIKDSYGMALTRFREGDFRSAKRHLAECLRADSHRQDVCLLLARIYREEGNFTRASACYQKAIESGVDSTVCGAEYGESLFEGKRYAEAEGVLREACDKSGFDVAAHLVLGKLLIQTGRFAETIDVLRRVTASYPDNSEALHLQGIVHFHRGDFENAVAVLEKAVESEPDHTPQTHLLLGKSYLALGCVDRALQSFKLSARIYPLPGLYYASACAYQMKQRYQTSLALFDKALDFSINRDRRDEILFRQGEILFELGGWTGDEEDAGIHYTQAIDKFSGAIELNPGFVAARHHLAMVHVRRGEISEAVEIFNELARIEPTQHVWQVEAGSTISLLEKPFLMLVHRGHVLALASRFDEGLAALEAAKSFPEVEAEPAFLCRILRRMGLILLDLKEYRKAADVWRELGAFDENGYYQAAEFLTLSDRLRREAG